MSKTIVIGNEKGGVGKTTSSVIGAVQAGLKKGKTLLVDLDPQNNASGALLEDFFETVSDSEMLTSDKLFHPLAELKPLTGKYGIDVIPASDAIHEFPQLLKEDDITDLVRNAQDANDVIQSVREKQLLSFVGNFSKLKKTYDYIVIDTPPSFLGLPLLAALCVVDELYILVTASKFSSQVVPKFLNKIEQVKVVNPKLKINGIVVNQYDRTSTKQPLILKKWNEEHGDLIKAVLPKASWIEHCGQEAIHVNENATNRTRKNVAKLVNDFFNSVWGK